MGPEEDLQPPADDLRSDIIKAFESESTAADEAAPPLPGAEPAPGTAMSPVERARDAQGRFIAQPPGTPTQAADAAVAQAQTRSPPAPQQQAQVPAGPPPGWSVASKALYASLPDQVKADIQKRESEVAQGFAKLAEYKGLDSYVEMARNANTTLPEALARYVNAENTLEADPISGMLWLARNYKADPVQLMYGLCQMYNIHPLQLVQAMGGDMPPGYQPPAEQGQPSLDPQTQQQLQAMNERLAYMEQEREAHEDRVINSQIHAFAQDPQNKYFPDVRGLMAHIIRTSPQNVQLTLKSVYDQACAMHPEVREALINERLTQRQQPSPQPRAVNRPGSLQPGSPVNGGTLPADRPAATLREEIERAFEQHRV